MILCAPHHGKEAAQARVHRCIYSGDFDHVFDRHECVGTENGDDWVRNEKLLFPNQSENLLVIRPEPGVESQATKPSDQQFWAYFVVLRLIGRSSKLHVLYLGLQGDHV